jgi:hypothetical protein
VGRPLGVHWIDHLASLSSLKKDQEYFVNIGQQPQRINLADVLDMSYAERAIRDLGIYA